MDEITTVEDLELLVGRPNDRVRDKVRHALHDLDRDWLAATPVLPARHERRRRQLRRLTQG